MKFEEREIATILAALNNWREVVSPEGGNDPNALYDFDHIEPLTDLEIGILIARIRRET